MPRQKLTVRERDAIDVLAHVFIAYEIDKHVPGMEGFFQHFEKKALTSRQRAIWKHFKMRLPSIRDDMAHLLIAEPENN